FPGVTADPFGRLFHRDLSSRHKSDPESASLFHRKASTTLAHFSVSKTRNSPTVGMSGSTSERVAVVTANARSLPLLMYSIDSGIVPNMICTCPPSRSVRAGEPPRQGTCAMSTPAIMLNNSPATWGVAPVLDDAMLIFFGLALA